MPFRSDAQRRLFHAKADRGEISRKTVKKWEAHTPKGKELPERVKKAGNSTSLPPQPKKSTLVKTLPSTQDWKRAGPSGTIKVPPATAAEYRRAAGKDWTTGAHKSSAYRLGEATALGKEAASISPLRNLLLRFFKKKAPVVRPIPNPAKRPAAGAPKKSAAFQMGEAMAKKAGPMAAIGRKAVMPAIQGILKPLQQLLGKVKTGPTQGMSKAIGKYRGGLRTDIAAGGRPGGRPSEELLKRLRTYGGVGTAAVGIPALAGILGGISGGRRRRAESELDEAMGKEAMAKVRGVMSKAKDVGKKVVHWGDKHPKVMYGVPAVAAATGAGVAISAGSRKKKKKEEGEEKEAQLGTPFMDGFLMKCARSGLDQKQTIDVIEKAAEKGDPAGKECKAFIERLAACKE